MRMSAKAEYAVRAMVQLATVDEGVLVKTDDLAKAQGIPPQFLVDILSDLRTDRLVRSHRGRDGGYELARPAAEISIADVLRCIDGPLASVRDIGLGDLPYSGPTAALTDVWRALRASMRSVLEETSLADVASGALPKHVAKMADDYLGQEEQRGHSSASGAYAVDGSRCRRAACAARGRSLLRLSSASLPSKALRCADMSRPPPTRSGPPRRRRHGPRVSGPASSACAAPTTKPSTAWNAASRSRSAKPALRARR